MNKFILLFFLFNMNASLAQSWDKFMPYSKTDKHIFEVDESSVSLSNDILNGWLKITNKNDGSINLDKLYFHCQTFQYSVLTRRSVDKNGKLLKIIFDHEIPNLKWNDTLDNSIGRNLGSKYCAAKTTIKLADYNWISLGRDALSEFSYSIDPSKNKIIQDELFYIAKIEYVLPRKVSNSNKEYIYILQETVVNCKDMTMTVLKGEFMNNLNSIVDKFMISKEFAKFDKTSSTSFAGTVASKYCDKKFIAITIPETKIPETAVLPENNDRRQSDDSKSMVASDKCSKLGYKKGSSPFDRCLKQLIDN